MTILWVALAAAAGLAAGWWLSRRDQPAFTGTPSDDAAPALLEWILRANQAQGVWMVGSGIREVALAYGVPDALDRLVSARLDQLRASDGQGSEPQGDGILLYASLSGRAAGLLLPVKSASSAQAVAVRDLARLLDYSRPASPAGRISGPQDADETVDSVALRLAHELERRLGVEACVGVPRALGLEILGVCTRSDRRLLRSIVQPDSVFEQVALGRTGPQAGVANPMGKVAAESRMGELAYVAPIPGSPGAVVVWTSLGKEPSGKTAEAFQSCLEAAGPRLSGALERRTAAEQAVRDHLTGLLNGTGIREAMAASSSGTGSLIEVRLDNLAVLKDELGEAARDSALVNVSRLLVRGVRGIDAVARIDADRFALWLPRAPFERARQVAERIRQALTWSDWEWDGKRRRISASFGVASCPETGPRERIWSYADAALDEAIQGGGDRVVTSMSRKQ